MPNEIDLGQLRLVLLPPGEYNLRHKLNFNGFDVNLPRSVHDFAINSDRVEEVMVGSESMAFFPRGTEFKMRVSNRLPGCYLEVSDTLLADWMEAGEVQHADGPAFRDYASDGVAAEFARSAIRHLARSHQSRTPVDRLTVEALALGIAARGMARIGRPDGDLAAEVARWSSRARPGAIERAVDLLESRLCEPDLTIVELARAAGMSSSHFASVFKSATGHTPYAFILRRRADFARDLIVGTREPLSWIAYEAGFSSQAHMTTVLRNLCGTTPAAMRN
ncbi:helix-turn-helix domain-containing protein [uncultured Roseobacter sp.]|uniref:helix-turn-helix domain-containing protein n=1 Tax=uncultured Roseobacter sp. TaxID=114847 RepID=UPI002625B805|nr:helix-turn-helix domain-containing protein [uncultured Roseobacter sp.]